MEASRYNLSHRFSPSELDRLRGVVASAPFVRRVMDSMPNLVGVLTDTRQLVLSNQAMRDFLGMEEGDLFEGPRPGEAIGCVNAHEGPGGCGTSAYCTQCGAFQTILEAITRRHQARGECRITYQCEGEVQNVELSLLCSPFMVEEHHFSILAAVDVSDQKRRDALERVFFHDVINTVNSLISYAHMIQEPMGQDTAALMDGMVRTAWRLADEIHAQRQLALAESNELEMSTSWVKAVDLARAIADRFPKEAWPTGVSLAVDVQDAPQGLHTDRVILGRVLTNMIKNALEASREGDTITVGGAQRDDRYELWVHNPQVMDPDVRLQVFQRSFTTKGRGRGLGTYSMRLLTERYLKGFIRFKSSEEEGTTFVASLPLNLRGAKAEARAANA